MKEGINKEVRKKDTEMSGLRQFFWEIVTFRNTGVSTQSWRPEFAVLREVVFEAEIALTDSWNTKLI